MLLKENFTREHINSLHSTHPSVDRTLLERAVFAFGLLEALSNVGMPFIFKGGTCLMLLLEHPNRLSTDIDIIVKPGCNILGYIEKTAQTFPFIRYEEKIRTGKNTIEKKHYKFFYKALTSDKEVGILLDVLFEENHYEKVVSKDIKNEFLLTMGEPTLVSVPTVDSLLGDKLTAFAPNTIGIPYVFINQEGFETDKRMEVIKQFFDVGTLISEASDFAAIQHAYLKVAQSEIRYRGLSLVPQDALIDTFQCSLAILSRGAVYKNEFVNLIIGIQKIRSHIFGIRFDGETAYRYAANVMLLVSGLLCNVDTLKPPISNQPFFIDPFYKKINPLKSLDEDAFNRAATAIRMLVNEGLV